MAWRTAIRITKYRTACPASHRASAKNICGSGRKTFHCMGGTIVRSGRPCCPQAVPGPGPLASLRPPGCRCQGQGRSRKWSSTAEVGAIGCRAAPRLATGYVGATGCRPAGPVTAVRSRRAGSGEATRRRTGVGRRTRRSRRSPCR
ncbi:hypothetical protein E0H26_25260 [Micromonospora zingiberis]|uniref:Uncharacterized protein n=1 Tax=Micromonospora zingiberis TaxID=2053011 RepID=A0A4R0G4H2_9ACTN|nr:hypothetical protein E0H26_25260 [Micromonospora zingiberis]